MTLQEMRERREVVRGEISKLNTTVQERRSAGKTGAELWDAEEQTQFETLTGEIGDLDTNIEAEERADSLQSHLARSGEQRSQQRRNGRVDPRLTDEIPGTDLQYGELHGDRDGARQSARREEQRCLALHAWACEQRASSLITDEHRQAIHDLQIHPSSNLETVGADNQTVQVLRNLLGSNPTAEQRSAAQSHLERRSIGYDSNYQDWVPSAFRDAFEIAFHGFGGVLSICDLMVTDSADQLPWPFADDYANEGHQVDGGTPEALAGTDAEMLIPKLGAYDFTSGFARISKALLANSPFDIATMLGAALGERIAKAIERKLTTGNRTDTLGGYMHRGVQGATVPVGAPVALTSLQSLIWSVITQHRDNGTIVMHDQSLAAYASLTDSANNPLLGIGNGRLQYGKDVFVPYRVSNYLKASNDGTLAAADKIVAFGNFKQMKVRVVRQIRLERFNEKFAENHQAAFMANRSADADLLRGSEAANCPVKFVEVV